MYTLQIDVLSANPLDGTTPLNINAPGVTVDKTSNRTIIVTLDAALVPNFGRFDPGQVAESQMPRLAGKPLVLVGFSAVSSGGAYIGVGNTLSRVTPPQGPTEAVQQIANLGDASVQGMVFGDPQIFPLAHQIAITTLPAGPTRLIFVLKELTDDDVVSLGCCGDGAAGTTCCPPQLESPYPPPIAPLPLFPARFGIDVGVPSVLVTFPASSCGLDEPLTATAKAYPGAPPALPPSINGVSVVGGNVVVDFNTTAADAGPFILEVTNACGCCTIIAGQVNVPA